VTDSTCSSINVAQGSPVVTNNTISFLYISGNSPTVTGNTISRTLDLDSFSGVPVITGNTFTGSSPLSIHDLDMDLSFLTGNIYTATDPQVYITGTVSNSQILDEIDGIKKYVCTDMTVSTDCELTVSPGVVIDYSAYSKIFVNGILKASGAILNIPIEVRSEGHADLDDCSLRSVKFYTGSSGSVVNCTGGVKK